MKIWEELTCDIVLIKCSHSSTVALLGHSVPWPLSPAPDPPSQYPDPVKYRESQQNIFHSQVNIRFYRSQRSAEKQNVGLRLVSCVIFPAFAHREVLAPFVFHEHPAFRNAHKYFSGKHDMAKFVLCIVVLLGVQYFVRLKSEASVGLRIA